nr:substrate-binding domain-containing protein [Microtetraspora malaysiensis]
MWADLGPRSRPPLLARCLLACCHPRCVIEAQEVTYDAAITALQEKDVDLMIAEPPIDDPAITVGPVLFTEPRALLVPASHPLAKREPVSLEDLAVLPMITPTGGARVWRDAHFPLHTPKGRPIRHGPRAAGWQAALSLVGAGKGTTVAAVRAGAITAARTSSTSRSTTRRPWSTR